jgi:malate synthase
MNLAAHVSLSLVVRTTRLLLGRRLRRSQGVYTAVPPWYTETLMFCGSKLAFDLQRRPAPALSVRPIDDVVPSRHCSNSQEHLILQEASQWQLQEMAQHNSEAIVEEVLPLRYPVVQLLLRPSLAYVGFSVPASSDKMLRKSLETQSDVIIFDLEDSVSPTRADKDAARGRLLNFLSVGSCNRRRFLAYTDGGSC